MGGFKRSSKRDTNCYNIRKGQKSKQIDTNESERVNSNQCRCDDHT